MKSFFTPFICLFFLVNAFSQEKIVYSIKESQFKIVEKGTTQEKKIILQKNATYKVGVEDYNPFYYKVKMDVETKDDLKSFFEFLIKSTKIDASTLPDIIGKLHADDIKNKIEDFHTNYNKAYVLNQDLKLRTFDYESILKKYNEIPKKEFLEDYLGIKKGTPPAEMETLIKQGFPTQEQVENLDLRLKELKEVLDIYQKNDKTFPVGVFDTNLNSKLILSLTFTAIDDTKDTVTINKTFPIKSAINVSFSTGIVTTWNAQKQYYTQQLSNGNYVIATESERKIMPAVAVLGNITLNKLPEFGISVGASLDVELTPNVLFGVTYIPKNSNLVFSSGVGMSYQKKLSDKYKINTEYTDEPDVSKTKDIYQSGFWVGISYKVL